MFHMCTAERRKQGAHGNMGLARYVSDWSYCLSSVPVASSGASPVAHSSSLTFNLYPTPAPCSMPTPLQPEKVPAPPTVKCGGGNFTSRRAYITTHHNHPMACLTTNQFTNSPPTSIHRHAAPALPMFGLAQRTLEFVIVCHVRRCHYSPAESGGASPSSSM